MQHQHRFSKVFRHTCRVCLLYFILCAIAVFILFIASVFDFFPAIATLAMFLAPHILRLGCLLSVGFIFVVVYEGLR
jgi:hypothetical protein